jgi:hypothetical protein
MELAIPLIALGGMYIISNQNQTPNQNRDKRATMESFENRKKLIPEFQQNYPVLNEDDLLDTDYKYSNPNTATDKYFNQNRAENSNSKNKPDNVDIFSLSGNYLASNDFKHNNMVPFYGAKMRGQMYNSNNSESVLDNMIGAGSQVISKVEQAPLFKPENNIQWTNGAPNMTEFYQSRQNNVLKNNMVKPFESVHVGPGLNQGYGSEGSGGFNSGLESREYWMPKSVDELRVDTNPRQEFSLENHQGPASTMVKQRGFMGVMEKHLPDASYENTPDRWLKTTGLEKASRNVAEEVFKNSNRIETTSFYAGSANSALKTASYTHGKVEDSKRQELKPLDTNHSCAAGKGPIHTTNHKIESFSNPKNNRSANNQPDSFGSSFNRAMTAAVAPLLDVFKPSKKEEHVSNIRVYGNVAGEVPGNYVINPYDKVGTTTKETTIYSPNTFIGNQAHGAYMVTDQQAVLNQRDTTNTDYVCGVGGGASRYGEMRYEAGYSQINNELKEPTTVTRLNHGNTNTFNSQLNVSFNRNQEDIVNKRTFAPTSIIPKSTTKEMYGKMDMNQYNTSVTDNRNEPDLLSAFKSNPYTHSLFSAV